MTKRLITCLLLSIIPLTASLARGSAKLVSDETIREQKRLTKSYKLKNGIPVIYRQIPNSDILEVIVNFGFGMKDLPSGKKNQPQLLFGTMPMAAKGFAKEKVFGLTEKYALQLGCSSGIEQGNCELGTLNEHWPKVLPLFASIINNPSLNKEDLKLTADRIVASVKANKQDPGRYVNDVVNRVYYGENHPYANPPEDTMKEIPAISAEELRNLHRTVLDASHMSIVVAGSYPAKKMLRDLNRYFGALKSLGGPRVAVQKPTYNAKKNIAFENRDIPTAYIRAKFNTVDINDDDEVAVNMLIKILDEELGEEIRTRRSLSYAVYSFVIQYSVGIGLISVSTSKPKETLEALTVVLDRLKTKKLTEQELEEYRNLYATRYFLTQESHSSLASAISSTHFYRKSVDPLYDMPRLLDRITPEQIQKLAKKLLVNMSLGVVYAKDRFQMKWAERFVKSAEAK